MCSNSDWSRIFDLGLSRFLDVSYAISSCSISNSRPCELANYLRTTSRLIVLLNLNLMISFASCYTLFAICVTWYWSLISLKFCCFIKSFIEDFMDRFRTDTLATFDRFTSASFFSSFFSSQMLFASSSASSLFCWFSYCSSFSI